MSLFATLSNVAALAVPPGERPPIPFTADGGFSLGDLGGGGAGMDTQLSVTTGESTLLSVLTLISTTVGRNKWTACRPAAPGARPDEEPVPVTAKDHLAVKLWNRPNRFMTGGHLRTLCSWHRAAVGEAWIVVGKVGKLPVSMWPVRPDRMRPQADAGQYLTGYIYRGPDGEDVPLELDEVLRLTFPHPLDPHRGLGPVQSLLTGLGTSMSAQKWIASFFRNDATPGGIISVPDQLEDHEFRQMKQRWNEQHRGTSRAHRVAILEYGSTWVPRQMSIKDMQFTEVRTLTRDQILEAFRIHQHMMGITEDVNLANATAADTTYGRRTDLPFLQEWEELANGPFLEMFGETGDKVEFHFDNPVPEDKEEDRADMSARVDNAIKLIGQGADWDACLDAFGLPPIPRTAPDPGPAPEQGQTGQDTNTTDSGTDPGQTSDTGADAPGINQDAMEKATALGVLTQKLYLGVEGNELWTRTEARELLANAGADITPEEWDADPKPAPPIVVPAPPGGDQGAPPVPAPEGAGPPEGEPVPEGEGSPTGHTTVSITLPADTQLTAALTRTLRDMVQPLRATPGPAGDVDLSQLDQHWQDTLDRVLRAWDGVTSEQYAALLEQVQTAIDAGDLDALANLDAPDAGGVTVLTDGMVAMATAGAAAVVSEAHDQGVTEPISQVVPKRTDLESYAKVVTALMRTALAASAGREALRAWGPEVTTSQVVDAVRVALQELTDAQPTMYLGGALTSAQNEGRAATMAEGPTARYFASEVLDQNTCVNCRQIDGHEFDTLAEARQAYPMGPYRKCLGRERCRGTFVAIYDIEGEG